MSRPASVYIAVTYFLSGLINFAPAVGVVSDSQLTRLYGIAIGGHELSLLLRHRALLLGIVGVLLLVAAFRQQLRTTAGLAGLFSMLSFTALAVLAPIDSSHLTRVAAIDAATSAALILAVVMHWSGSRRARHRL